MIENAAQMVRLVTLKAAMNAISQSFMAIT
jgi:hypothetical protein